MRSGSFPHCLNWVLSLLGISPAVAIYLFNGGKMDPLYFIITIVLLVPVCFYLGWYFNSRAGKKSLAAADVRAKQILEDAEKEAQNIKREKLLEVKDEWYKKKVEFDQDLNHKRQKQQHFEKQLAQREENIDKKLESALQKEKENKQLEREINDQKRALENRRKAVESLEKEQNLRLEKISGLTSEEAKKMLMENMIQDARSESNKMVKSLFEKAKSEAKKESQKIIIQAIQRTAAECSVETTVSVVQIQNDELKGRIIGKEGRNIRAFEAATGVDVIVDDTPEAVILSSYDQFRREVARVSLERLINDGRIHPARIEEIVDKVGKELEEEMGMPGREAAC